MDHVNSRRDNGSALDLLYLLRAFSGSGRKRYIVGWIIHPADMNTPKITIIAILTALSIGTNYAMISFYNVKFMNLIVFVAGFCFGPLVGAFVGILSWSVYGVINPMGFSLHIWLATMFAESVYGIIGGLARKPLTESFAGTVREQLVLCAFFGLLGVFMTLFYDVVTNVVFGYVSNSSILVTILLGVPFSMIHVISNALFFGVVCVPAINAVARVTGGTVYGIPKK